MPTETGRHKLYETIKEAWGEDAATELMSHLPPVGWADVATKQDLEVFGAELRGEIAKLEMRMERGFTKQAHSIVGAMVGLTAIFTAVVGLFTFLG